MTNETRAPEIEVPAAQAAISTSAAWLRIAATILLGSAFVAVCSRVALPLYFTPVPLTLQPMAILLLGLVLSPRLAAAALLAYLAEGAAGLPVFSPAPASAGLAHLFGPTGGYLLAYPGAAMFISVLFGRTRRGFSSAVICAALGSLAILGGGALWLSVLTHASLRLVLTQAILPFLPGDVLKIVAAAALATGWQRLRHRNLSSLPTP